MRTEDQPGNLQRGAERRDWTDLGYTAILQEEREYAHVVAKFKVYEIHSVDAQEFRSDGTVLVEGIGYGLNSEIIIPAGQSFIAEFTRVEEELSCSIRWDGCSDFQVGPLHFCGEERARRVGELFGRIYSWGRELGMDRC